MKAAGFTLIELLVIIAIIGILAGIVLTNLNGTRLKAQITEAESDMGQIKKVITIARDQASTSLRNITNSNCSDCECRSTPDLRGNTSSCYTNWTSALTKIQAAAGGSVDGLTNLDRDPWGSPYFLDENEDEGDCRIDVLRSVGPDGAFNTTDDINMTISRRIPC